jgi:hypothetical protein
MRSTDIARHLRGYNALEAMRFQNGYIKQVVIGEAVVLVGLGFAPGARQLNHVLVSQRVSLALGTVLASVSTRPC